MHLWFWVWVLAAVVLALVELWERQLFEIPWAAGAAVAAVLEYLGVYVGWQWGAFVGLGSVLTVVLQRWRRRQTTTNTEPSRTTTP